MFPLIRRHVLLLPVLETQVCRKQKETFLLKNTDMAIEVFLIFSQSGLLSRLPWVKQASTQQ